MFNGVNSTFDCIVGSTFGLYVSCDRNTSGMRFINDEANVICRVNVRLGVDNNFDYLRPKINVLANGAP